VTAPDFEADLPFLRRQPLTTKVVAWRTGVFNAVDALALTKYARLMNTCSGLVVYTLCIQPQQEMTMSYTERDTYGMYKKQTGQGPGPFLMGASTLLGEEVYGNEDEYLGEIKEFMMEMDTGRVAYAVLSFGGFLGLGEKLFAVPWNALKLDTVNKRFVLNVEKDRLKNAPGFDKDDWPDMTDQSWASGIQSFYGAGADSTKH
jgi:sporulation protein YlmC with PRC-barrel domain